MAAVNQLMYSTASLPPLNWVDNQFNIFVNISLIFGTLYLYPPVRMVCITDNRSKSFLIVWFLLSLPWLIRMFEK